MEKLYSSFDISFSLAIKILFNIIIIISFGCNETSNSNPKDIKDTGHKTSFDSILNVKDKRPKVGAPLISNNLYLLSLSEENFRHLTSKKGDRSQIAFEYCVRNDTPDFVDRLTLKGWPGKNDHLFKAGDARLLDPFRESDVNITGRLVFFAIQKLNRDRVEEILDYLNETALDDEVLVFYPELPGSGNIYYEIDIIPKTDIPALTDKRRVGFYAIPTNPSPPGRFTNDAVD